MSINSREGLTIFVFLVPIVAVLQWLLLLFTHWSIALGVTSFIALFVSFVYVSLTHASPNGGSDPTFTEFGWTLLVVFVSLFFGLCVVAYLSERPLPEAVFLYVLSSIVLLVVALCLYQYVKNLISHNKHFSICTLEVLVAPTSLPLVKEIRLKNTSKGHDVVIEPHSNGWPVTIPRDADTIVFRCVDAKTKRIIPYEFDFDYSWCQEIPGQRLRLLFWLREYVASPMKIDLQTSGKVDLYMGNILMFQYDLMSKIPQNTKKEKTRH